MKNQCVAYFRVSTSRQGESGLGLDAQRETVRRFASSHGLQIIAEHTEVESGKVNDRPKLTEALHLCRKTGATLVVSKLDRLSRSAIFLLQLQQSNVEFVCCDAPNVDRFTVGILALVAQRERELISERTKSALSAAKARGVRLGTRDPQRQVKIMAAAYRRQKEDFIAKITPVIEDVKKGGVTTLKGIAECLTRRGIPTRNGKSVWFGSTVKAVLC
jgi:DNA invertase Pin-like site-specific DNA recombinase